MRPLVAITTGKVQIAFNPRHIISMIKPVEEEDVIAYLKTTDSPKPFGEYKITRFWVGGDWSKDWEALLFEWAKAMTEGPEE